MSRPVAVLLLVICTMLWGFAFIMQKTAMDHMGPLTYAGSRYLLGTIVLIPFALAEYRRVRPSISTNQWLRIGAICLAFFFGSWLQQTALLTASVTSAGFLTALYVLFVPLLTFIAIRVRPHPIIYLGVPMALVGTYLLTGARLDRFTSGDAMLVVCAVFWAVQIAMLGPLVKETNLPIGISVLTFAGTAILCLGGAFGFEQPTLSQVAAGWQEIAYAGVFSTAIAFTLQAIGQRYVPPANSAIILSAESLFAAAAGAVFLHERLPPAGYAGAALIFVAIVMVEAVPAFASKKAPMPTG
jgi:drug/metabolite transporter (DMT)-like permease